MNFPGASRGFRRDSRESQPFGRANLRYGLRASHVTMVLPLVHANDDYKLRITIINSNLFRFAVVSSRNRLRVAFKLARNQHMPITHTRGVDDGHRRRRESFSRNYLSNLVVIICTMFAWGRPIECDDQRHIPGTWLQHDRPYALKTHAADCSDAGIHRKQNGL